MECAVSLKFNWNLSYSVYWFDKKHKLPSIAVRSKLHLLEELTFNFLQTSKVDVKPLEVNKEAELKKHSPHQSLCKKKLFGGQAQPIHTHGNKFIIHQAQKKAKKTRASEIKNRSNAKRVARLSNLDLVDFFSNLNKRSFLTYT